MPASDSNALYSKRAIVKAILLLCPLWVALLVLLHFPYDTDPSPQQLALEADKSQQESAGFYQVAYRAEKQKKRGLDYEEVARAAADRVDIVGQVRQFVADYRLSDKRVLEVGSGRGYLQDIVDDYTGLDLSPSVARLYHKPFVAASATQMPFADNSFDAVWTVWVLEHIPEPQRALREIRRVLKPDGVLFLYVAWNCVSWAAEGFDVRPYSDFNWRGKLVKASIPLRSSPLFALSHILPTRAIRWAHYSLAGEETRLRFRALEPNYKTYWRSDSDAAISLDSFETYLWFRAQGDRCLNCGSAGDEILRGTNPLMLQIQKP